MATALWKNPKRTPAVAAFAAVLRAHRGLTDDFRELFRSHGLTEPRYDVLRILRNAGEGGMPSQEIGRRLYTRVPDVTRLVDGLERLGLVGRERCPEDRRVVYVTITTAGLGLLAELDGPVLAIHRRQFADFDREELATLTELLDRLDA